jgi:hypothetical protein
MLPELHVINEQPYEWYAQWSLKDWFALTYKVCIEWPWPLHNDLEWALSEKYCLKGISLSSY